MLALVGRRLGLGVITILIVTLFVYWATLILPGNAATAILGQQATPQRIAQLKQKLHLNQSPLAGYWHWFTSLLHGNSGTSLVNGQSVAHQLLPRLENSAILVLITTLVSTILGVAIVVITARVRDSAADHVVSVISLAASSLPEFVASVFVIYLFSVNVFHWFPSVSVLAPGQPIWREPSKLVLPVLALVVVATPYVIRMMRAAMIEALNSEYVEVARLKGLPERTVLLRHALPNALPPTIAVIGLNILYLAGGIVLVEAVFNFPGIGYALVSSVNNRDVPVIQYIVLLLATFYVVLNIVIDVLVLLVTPSRRVAK